MASEVRGEGQGLRGESGGPLPCCPALLRASGLGVQEGGRTGRLPIPDRGQGLCTRRALSPSSF